MNNLLKPEQNNLLLKKYHTSGKLIIPLLLPSILLKDKNDNLSKMFHGLNILNIGFHSYVSTSCVITDYIKPKNLSKIVRGTSFASHMIATYGLMYYIFKSK